MAIIKTYETPQGVNATYHKVVKGEISVATSSIEITVAIFASVEARDSGKNVLWHEYVRLPFERLANDPRNMLYQMLAAFEGSYLQNGASDVTTPACPEAALLPAPEPVAAPEPEPVEAPVIPVE